MPLIRIKEPHGTAESYCRLLEQGDILLFDSIPFSFSERQREFLLEHQPGDSRIHKNISYRPLTDVLRGFSGASKSGALQMKALMRQYSRAVIEFLSRFLAPYSSHWTVDFASFRPCEEQGRDLSFHKRNDLLHVDAFPSRPTHGGRILRIFSNIHRERPRVWNTTGPFEQIAARHAASAGLAEIASSRKILPSGISRLLRSIGIAAADRAPYDRFMLRFHDALKENEDFQTNSDKLHTEFAPGSTWIVFTDGVAHAALSGQFALEQTFIVPLDALVSPEKAPIRILEKLCAAALA